jgi:hypothetical protein
MPARSSRSAFRRSIPGRLMPAGDGGKEEPPEVYFTASSDRELKGFNIKIMVDFVVGESLSAHLHIQRSESNISIACRINVWQVSLADIRACAPSGEVRAALRSSPPSTATDGPQQPAYDMLRASRLARRRASNAVIASQRNYEIKSLRKRGEIWVVEPCIPYSKGLMQVGYTAPQTRQTQAFTRQRYFCTRTSLVWTGTSSNVQAASDNVGSWL